MHLASCTRASRPSGTLSGLKAGAASRDGTIPRDFTGASLEGAAAGLGDRFEAGAANRDGATPRDFTGARLKSAAIKRGSTEAGSHQSKKGGRGELHDG
ncbi:hypothetical protein SCAR479_02881 [Seiridium cardinale]|uniref:Uncharacterized protein n=1 Tax=Seiridium cardinale TaxID=138064 RepID=A0ABR2Y2E5_9PEZI